MGFIRDLLPHWWSFRATLEETLDADVLLLVDLADPDWQGHLDTVHRLLDELGSSALRRVVANQIDRCEASAIRRFISGSPTPYSSPPCGGRTAQPEAVAARAIF